MYMLILNFTYPLRCLRVPPVEYHCSRPFTLFPVSNEYEAWLVQCQFIDVGDERETVPAGMKSGSSTPQLVILLTELSWLIVALTN
jgi:hypothetical protein